MESKHSFSDLYLLKTKKKGFKKNIIGSWEKSIIGAQFLQRSGRVKGQGLWSRAVGGAHQAALRATVRPWPAPGGRWSSSRGPSPGTSQ